MPAPTVRNGVLVLTQQELGALNSMLQKAITVGSHYGDTLIDRIGRGADLIGTELEATALVRRRAAESTGRPLGADDFLKRLERRLGRTLRPRKPGPKPGAVAPGGQLDMEIGK